MSTAEQSAQYIATYLNDLHSVWQPHPGQIGVGQALFYKDKKRVFVRCGRKFGKTEVLCYVLYRWAGTIPNGQFYYVAPFYNQAAEIIWHPGRLKYFLGEHAHKYIESVNDTDRRIVFKNGSFIKLVGSDNHQAGRGFNPDGAVYDEFKDHDYRFHEGFEPNLIAKKSPLLIVGTPPESYDHFFVRTEEDFKLDERGAYFKSPTSSNPYIDPYEIRKAKESAERKGEWAKYMREYEAEIVPGGANSIFPMLEIPRYDEKGEMVGTTEHVKDHEELLNEVQMYHKDWNYYWINDPGSTKCFASLFIAIHKHDRRVYVLDEIYETDKKKTSTRQIVPIGMKKTSEIYKDFDTWFKGYDHAAAWFSNEVIDLFNFSMTPCSKEYGADAKEDKLSLIKDLILFGYYKISKRAVNHIKEMSTYATDENGKIPKGNDHTIDALRYGLSLANYTMAPKTPYQKNDDIRIYMDSNEYDYEEDVPINIYELESEFLNE
jgi:hypothetical protein